MTATGGALALVVRRERAADGRGHAESAVVRAGDELCGCAGVRHIVHDRVHLRERRECE
jgi:hypothetical protein